MQVSIVVVTGVSGAGKTTVGQALALRLGWPFQDADDLHPQANIAKMAAGQPLDDADRAPWLLALRRWVDAALVGGGTGILAASLLKRTYRDQVIGGDARVALVYLYGEASVLRRRMEARRGHFMRPKMLGSQLAALEPPAAAEHALSVDVGGDLEQTVAAVVEQLYLQRGPGAEAPALLTRPRR